MRPDQRLNAMKNGPKSRLHKHSSNRRGECRTERESGQGRDRTGDLTLFRRTLLPTELPGRRNLLVSATPTGLEPATSAVTGRRANQLRYGALEGLSAATEAAARASLAYFLGP